MLGAADVLLVCVDLPRVIYPPNRSFIFHNRVAELLFRDQPILQTLALENALITVTVGTGLNHIQRNVIREWLSRPVTPDHRVYLAATEYLTEAETDAAADWSEPYVARRRRRSVIPPGLLIGWNQLRRSFQFAIEASRRSGRLRKKKKRKRHEYGRRPPDGDREEQKPLIDGRNSPTYEIQELSTFNDVNSDVMLTWDHVTSNTWSVRRA